MRVRADLHIHSHYSRATSSKLSPPYLERWASIKGIDLLGTGDCTHPLWLGELREQLDDGEPGLYILKETVRSAFDAGPGDSQVEGLPYPGDPAARPRFVLTGEISTIYKKNGRTRKVHHLVILPDFKAAVAFQSALERAGNIRSDGRPILGIDSRDLLAMLLDTDDRALLIPAHIWTPWFSALGANSGFDSIEECYGDLAFRIPAIETGLSSNPPMNWAIRSLDRFAIISNSDAHSPDKLGREGTVFDMELSFTSLSGALRSPGRILETIEFFPQEGKYHYDGHRNCGIFLGPREAAEAEGCCPVCGRPLTRGVMGRVLELAGCPVDEAAPFAGSAGGNRRPYRSLIPLKEIVGELLETGPSSKKVEAAYGSLISKAGSELALLMDASPGDIEALRLPGLSGELLSEAIQRMRSGTVSIKPGYDGVYGRIRVFPEGQQLHYKKNKELFEGLDSNTTAKNRPAPSPSVPAAETGGRGNAKRRPPSEKPRGEKAPPSPFGLSEEQTEAVSCQAREAIIIAGPGTGKTAVLAARIGRLLLDGVDPVSILAVSFTVKAAAELRERAGKISGVPFTGGDGDRDSTGRDGNRDSDGRNGDSDSAGLTVVTFHSFCASLLREQDPDRGIPANFRIAAGPEREGILEEIAKAAGIKKSVSPRRLGEYIESRKRFLLLPGEDQPWFLKKTRSPEPVLDSLFRLAGEFGLPPIDTGLEEGYRLYRGRLRGEALLDFEDLIAGTVRLLAGNPESLEKCRRRYRHILVDEYQDINFAQYCLIRLLAPTGEGSPELRVIGDPNQAIYAFRGSDRRFIDRFLRDYPRAACFQLSRSFRCAAPILNAAGRLTGTRLEGADETGVRLFRSAFPTEKSEAEGIARRIAGLVGGTSFFAIDSNTTGGTETAAETTSPGECAVLLRSIALARPIIKALEDHGIPYDLTGEKPWWEEEPALSLTGLLWESLSGNTPSDSGFRLNKKSPAEAIRTAWEFMAKNKPAVFLRGKKTQVPDSDDVLNRLIHAAAFYDGLREFLDTLAVSGNADLPEIKREGVRIMTIHGSKGLEFDHVFIPALEEGLLPLTLFEENRDVPDTLIEEEQRLLYVAMTRSRRGLYLSRSESRTYGKRKLKLAPSRFLDCLETIIPQDRDRTLKRRDPQQQLF
ncbi:MAG: UvrD-helicase domain-containing protein [Spirochaetaceae bacterium]|jgi:uncharacterized protein (TIGR00375 family)|nr:UvrD-helicase domain-containing protein [Spirochaetaceae bacterium]